MRFLAEKRANLSKSPPKIIPEGVPVYDSSGEKAVFIVVCRSVDLLVCQRVDEFRLPAIRY